MAAQFVVAALLLVVIHPSTAKLHTFSNVKPRIDSLTGEILELGDGSLAKFGDRYYLYGVKYVCTPSPRSPLGYGCPKRDRRIWGNMSIGIASSMDMVSWKLETYNAIPEMHDDSTVYPAKNKAWFMPTIVHNPKTGRFALWYYIDDFARGVAVSNSPTGPFKIVHHCIPNLGLGSSFFFWTGSDGEVYMKHNGCGPGAGIVKPGGVCPQSPPSRGSGICVSRLAANLTDVAETSSEIQIPGEGGGIFERDGKWYIMQGSGCCFCWAGDDATMFESIDGPFGPYTMQNDIINCSHRNHRGYPGQGVTSNLTCGGPGPGYQNACNAAASSQCVNGARERGPGAQQFGVFNIPSSGGRTAFLYVGIRFGSAPDGNKCREFQYWDALEFDQRTGRALPLHFKDEVTLDLVDHSEVTETSEHIERDVTI